MTPVEEESAIQVEEESVIQVEEESAIQTHLHLEERALIGMSQSGGFCGRSWKQSNVVQSRHSNGTFCQIVQRDKSVRPFFSAVTTAVSDHAMGQRTLGSGAQAALQWKLGYSLE